MRRVVKREKKPGKKHQREPVPVRVTDNIFEFRKKYPPIESDDPAEFGACLRCFGLVMPITRLSDGKIQITCGVIDDTVIVKRDITDPEKCEHALNK